ncbi:toll/interleukin-1 receptor domain-containing protein [Cupriavidus necator]|uniref:toll/interleukin-1 receptor domain-containing protein n=1 Tax=Cupriavidus necator TaxID=106590 RepID=UPI003ED09EFB
MADPLYQCAIFGAPTAAQVDALCGSIADALGEFGLQADTDYRVSVGLDDRFCETATTVAIFFGGPGLEFAEYARLLRLSIPVIPIVSTIGRVAIELPACLHPINALALDAKDRELLKPTSVALQCLGLLPVQRRVFLSYRRDDSRDVALQLFEALSARQFDVFLDTHSVATAADFQAMLWHRLCDSDVVVMLDTPGYFESRWTTREWGRAIDKYISILQVVWPEHTPSRFTRLATPLNLDADDLADDVLMEQAVSRIALQVEALRSKSIALRHANLAGQLRSVVEALGGAIEGFGPRRSIILTLPDGAPLVAYPSVGVPTAITLQEAHHENDGRRAVVVYDHVGLSDQWIGHLQWLGMNIPAVKWIKTREAGWQLPELEGT